MKSQNYLFIFVLAVLLEYSKKYVLIHNNNESV